MPCFSPLRAFKAPGGQIVFSRAKGWSDRPLDIPCGQCIGCRISKAQSWALRCVHESSMHNLNSFVTLTYSDEFLPPDGSLDITHWQKFAKRLRRRMGPFRYFHCGEYGDENARPHYHACIFGLDFSGDRFFHKSSNGNRLYVSPFLNEVWGKGYALIGDLTYESAAYVARYCLKKLSGEAAHVRYNGVDMTTGEELPELKPEYISMSRRPGLGASWFEKFESDVYPADEVVHQGRRHRPPRFYDDKLPPDELKFFQARRYAKACLRSGDLNSDRLVVREKVLERRMEACIRSI